MQEAGEHRPPTSPEGRQRRSFAMGDVDLLLVFNTLGRRGTLNGWAGVGSRRAFYTGRILNTFVLF